MKDELDQLKQAEKEADGAVEAARAEAARAIADAEASVTGLVSKAVADAEREAGELIRRATEQAQKGASKLRGDADARCRELNAAIETRVADIVDELARKLVP